jgi:Ca2+-transporting ATPase
MTVTHIWSGGREWRLSGTGYEPKGEFFVNEQKVLVKDNKSLQQILTFGMLCNTANIYEKDDDYILDGDPTEGALVVAAMKAGLSKEALSKQFKIIEEFPFDSIRKMMSVIIEDKNGKRFVITKGAPDILLQKLDFVLWDEKQHYMSAKYETKINEAIDNLASQALRTIAVAFKPVSAQAIYHQHEAEKNLVFLGLQGMIDPPRPEVKQAVKECRQAGIKTVMITGDHVNTARAIAKQLDLLPANGKVIDGAALSAMPNEELVQIVDDIYVFARVSPEHKLKIVKALQSRGHIVAMTGDGVNDAPAIKAADIGISMEASALILVDDNFATIKLAIKEGRNIYENIRKFIRYLLASNVGEILVMLFAMLLALPLPLVPIQILWVNLVTDGLPAMALGLDQPEGDLMQRKPRHHKEGVFARGLGWKVISRGFLIGIVTLAAFMIVYHRDPDNLIYAQTIAFATLVMAQLIHVFDCRSERSVFLRNPFENLYLVGAVISSVLLMLAVIYYAPMQPIFHTVPIMARDWLLVLGLSAIPTFLLAGSLLTRKKS